MCLCNKALVCFKLTGLRANSDGISFTLRNFGAGQNHNGKAQFGGMQLSHKYETERLELKAKIQALRQKQNPENCCLLPLCRVCGNTRGISKTAHQSRHPQRRCRGVSYRAENSITKRAGFPPATCIKPYQDIKNRVFISEIP